MMVAGIEFLRLIAVGICLLPVGFFLWAIGG